jgi:hypothetical protein
LMPIDARTRARASRAHLLLGLIHVLQRGGAEPEPTGEILERLDVDLVLLQQELRSRMGPHNDLADMLE